MNHRVQSEAKGCFTLKLSLSSKTVTALFSEALAASEEAEGLLPPSGEMGMVDKSTCSDILTVVWVRESGACDDVVVRLSAQSGVGGCFAVETNRTRRRRFDNS